MEQHFREEHPEFKSLNDQRLSLQFKRAIQITRDEQKRLKIPEEYLVDNEVFDEPHNDDEGPSNGKRKRGRSTTNAAPRQGKKKA